MGAAASVHIEHMTEGRPAAGLCVNVTETHVVGFSGPVLARHASGMPSPDDLSRVPLFADLDHPDLEVLAQSFEAEDFGPGRRIVGEGDAGYSFFVVAEGRAAVTHGDRQVGYLDSGDYFGEMAILGDDGRRTASVTAVTPVVAWVMFGISFRTLQRNHPDIAEQIERSVAQRQALYAADPDA